MIERAIKIALTTTEQIVKKDHALDHDETRMRTAAHSTTRNLTAGMAMITCKEHVQVRKRLISLHFEHCKHTFWIRSGFEA